MCDSRLLAAHAEDRPLVRDHHEVALHRRLEAVAVVGRLDDGQIYGRLGLMFLKKDRSHLRQAI